MVVYRRCILFTGMIFIEFLIIAVIFFFLGRYSTTYKKDQNKPSHETIDDIVEQAHRLVVRPKITPGNLPFKTPEEREAEASGDKALEDEWKRSGIADRIQQ